MPNRVATTAPAEVAPPAGRSSITLSRSDLVILGGSAVTTLVAYLTRETHPAVVPFIFSAICVAMLAALVGRCVERLGDRLGAGATGVLQSALGNLPELFIAFFALRKGLLLVVQSAIIGSILANLLLVLGAAFMVGGFKHGTLRFDHGRARTTGVLLALATAALVLPSLAKYTNSPAARHETPLSVAVAIVLLAVFILSLPSSLRRNAASQASGTADTATVDDAALGAGPVGPGGAGSGAGAVGAASAAGAAGSDPAAGGATGGAGATGTVAAAVTAEVVRSEADSDAGGPDWGATGVGDAVHAMGTEDETHHEGHWPIWFAVIMLGVAGLLAALVSDWFVNALTPAMNSLHISQAFAGLVIVAIAGNAVENVVGIQLAARNQADYALSVIINSPLQIALVLAPVLVLLSFFTATTLTLVFAPLLIVSVVVAVLITTFIVFDGESNWLEGAILVALYAIIATLFWWG